MLNMKSLTLLAALILSAIGFAQPGTSFAKQTGTPQRSNRVMVVAVAHDTSVIGGGTSSSNILPPGIASVEPIAWITSEGNWVRLDCIDGKPQVCKKFDRTYLSQPHDYSVISADGHGTSVHVQRMELDHECFGMGGRGKFSVGAIRSGVVAAEKADLFSVGASAHRLPESDSAPMRKALAQAVGSKLDTTKELGVYEVDLDGHDLLIFQRAFRDWASKPEYAHPTRPNSKKCLPSALWTTANFGFFNGKRIQEMTTSRFSE
jgi:hypothetical protein